MLLLPHCKPRRTHNLHTPIQAKVTWHPFFLNPSLPTEGIDKLKYYNKRFGGEENVNACRVASTASCVTCSPLASLCRKSSQGHDPTHASHRQSRRHQLFCTFDCWCAYTHTHTHGSILTLGAPSTRAYLQYGGKVANTLDTHRLILWAAQNDKQDEMVEALFHAYVRTDWFWLTAWASHQLCHHTV